MINVRLAKENAKKHYTINRWNNVIVSLIYFLVAGAASWIPSYIIKVNENVKTEINGLSGLVNIFLIWPLAMGLMNWFRRSISQQNLGVESIFDVFTKKYGSNVLTMFLKNLFTALWAMLLIVPGIVKVYSYYATDYIKMENPDIEPSRAIEISKKMTYGNKMDLFCLDLSFIGWFILSAFTCGILAVLYVMPYYQAARAFAYEEMKAEAVANGRIDLAEIKPFVESQNVDNIGFKL